MGKDVFVRVWDSGFPGQVDPDVARWMDEEEAVKAYGEPDVRIGLEWEYF